ncbi:MAG: hypothetical protein E3J72_17400 [Planctomycetota bacterium]|nr:MAG: hypothetical protein E3J72_17400 [Planctomycetota bacterium]
MKSGLPLKLGIVVIALFALVIGGFALYKPLKFQYWRGRLQSKDAKVREKAVEKIIQMAPYGQMQIARDFIKAPEECSASIAIVLVNSGWVGFDAFDRDQFMNYVKVLMSDEVKEYKTSDYHKKVQSHLFSVRPSGRNDDYYDLLYRFGKRIYVYSYPDGSHGHPTSAGRFDLCYQAPDGRWLSEDGSIGGDLMTTGMVLISFAWYWDAKNYMGQSRDQFEKGLDFLSGRMNENGSIFPNTVVQALCAGAICDFGILFEKEKIDGLGNRAITNLLSRQLENGGFPAREGETTADIRSTCYAAMAIRAARMLGLGGFPGQSGKILEYLDSAAVFVPELSKEEPVRNQQLLHAAMAVTAGVYSGRKRTHPAVSKATELVGEYLPSWKERRDTEYIFWGTAAKFELGGSQWKKWNEAMKKTLLYHQRAGRHHHDGSWNPVMGELSEKYGRVFTTAMCATILDIYYRYARANVGRRK